MPNRLSPKAGRLAGDPHPADVYAAMPGLREARENAGLSIEELAAMSGYSPEMIAHWEAGHLAVPRITSSRLSAAMATPHTQVRED